MVKTVYTPACGMSMPSTFGTEMCGASAPRNVALSSMTPVGTQMNFLTPSMRRYSDSTSRLQAGQSEFGAYVFGWE